MEEVQAPGKDASMERRFRHVHPEEPWQMKDTLERLDVLFAWGMPWDSLGGHGESGSVYGLPPRPRQGKERQIHRIENASFNFKTHLDVWARQLFFRIRRGKRINLIAGVMD